MAVLQNKIDFAVIFKVTHANPNGDPLNGNRPRTDYNGFGEITDVCLKRKMRDRLMEAGQDIFVQSDDRRKDTARSLRERAESVEFGLGKQAFVFAKGKKGNKRPKNGVEVDATGAAPAELTQMSKTVDAACAKWFDVRAFGNLFAWKSAESKGEDASAEGGEEASGKGVSIPIRGPVTVRSAFSGTKRGSDTMGMKHRVDAGIYVTYGSMNPQLAERTSFSDADASAIKSVLSKLFENDASSARPEGSMQVLKVIWWKHNSKAGQYSSARVHRSLSVKPDGQFELADLEGLVPEIIEGF